MKLTKKIICVAMVAAMSLTSLTAFATVPAPKDNTQAFIWAENYYNNGLYYEAREELSLIQPIYSHEQEKLNFWSQKVQYAITRWEVSESFRKVSEDYEKNEIVSAYNRLHKDLSSLAVNGGLTLVESKVYSDWVAKLDKGIETEDQAIVAVEDFINDILWDPDLYYSVEKVEKGWDVYVKSHKTLHNVAAYFVDTDLAVGDANDDAAIDSYADVEKWENNAPTYYQEKKEDVRRTAIDYNGNPAAEFEKNAYNVNASYPYAPPET